MVYCKICNNECDNIINGLCEVDNGEDPSVQCQKCLQRRIVPRVIANEEDEEDDAKLIEIYHDEQKNYDYFELETHCSDCNEYLGSLDMTFKPGELQDGFKINILCPDCKETHDEKQKIEDAMLDKDYSS